MVIHYLYSFVLVVICLQLALNVVNGVTYTAGVVELAPNTLLPSSTPEEVILSNTQIYVDIIKSAATHDVDILVFPECGLTSIKIPFVRSEIFPYLTEIPDIGVNPCDLPQAPKVLQQLSCAAKDNQIYIVVNLSELGHCAKGQANCPADGSLFFNTNIAFDRSGKMIAKYRKTNLFIEPEFNVTECPDYSWFDTDFGVRFGMFICFDILFKEPTVALLTQQNISNFVYSTAWFSEIPFLTAVSVQAGWAYANDVNLLAAGYSNTSNMNAGSGIYAGRDGKLVAVMPEHSSTKLLIARVNSDQRGGGPSPTEEISFTEDTSTALNFFHYDLENYTSVVATESGHLEYSNEGFTCKITTEISATGNGPTYRLVAFSGARMYAGVASVYLEVCGVIACSDSKLSSCGHRPSFHVSNTVFSKISIKATSDRLLLSYPITLGKNLLSFAAKNFNFRSQKNLEEYEISMDSDQPQVNFIAFALFRNG